MQVFFVAAPGQILAGLALLALVGPALLASFDEAPQPAGPTSRAFASPWPRKRPTQDRQAADRSGASSRARGSQVPNSHEASGFAALLLAVLAACMTLPSMDGTSSAPSAASWNAATS